MATSTPSAAPAGASAPSSHDARDRRAFWRAGIALTVTLVVSIAVYVAIYPDPGPGKTRAQQVQGAQVTAPHIIPRPEDGRAPENPGDPGGWEQLALLGVIVAGMGTVGGLAWRSSRRARARVHHRAASPS